MYKQIDELLKGLEPIKAVDTSQKLVKPNLIFGAKYSFDKNSIEAFVSYMAIAQLDQYSDLKEARSLSEIHESKYFMDKYLSFYFRRLLQQSDNQLTLMIDRIVDIDKFEINVLSRNNELESLVFDFLVNRIAFEREIDLALYLMRYYYRELFNNATKVGVNNFYVEFKESKKDFDEYFYDSIDLVNYRSLEGITEYDIEMLFLSFMKLFGINISYKRAIKFNTYLCAFHKLGRENRVVQKLMVEDILNNGLNLDKQQDIVPDNPIEPEETKKRGPKL